jgi:hypothetical protein
MTTAKLVQISDDNVTYYTLPGSSGEFNDDADTLEDTIFGQTFSSTQTGLISWTANAQAFYKGFAGYVASVKRSGTSTSMTAEATTLVSGKTYRINNTAKEVWDWTKALTVLDNAIAVSAANIETINWLFGTVTFVPAYVVSGAVTITGWYLPLAEVAKASSFTLTQTVDAIDKTDFDIAHGNDGYRVFIPGLRTVSCELGGFYDATEAFWEVLEARDEIVIEINPDGSGLSLARGIFKMTARNQSGDVGALEEESRTFNLAVPSDIDVVFNWRHEVGTTLHQSIQIMLQSFIDQTLVFVKYAPEGLDNTLFFGEAVAIDMSLSSGVDAMNEFTANFQGSDQPTRQAPSS